MNSELTRASGWTASRFVVALALLAIFGLAAWAILRNRSDDVASPQAMDAMPEMPGMDKSGSGSLRLAPEHIRDFGITFDFAEERMLNADVRTVGIVNFDETRVAAIVPKFGGFAERLYVDFTGSAVRRGEALVEIYSPELVAAQEELLLAETLRRNMGDASVPGLAGDPSSLVRAARQRLELWDISSVQIDEILRDGRSRRTLTLYAPFAGVVIEKNVVAGQAIQPGETLYLLADLSRVWVEAELREADAGLIREGAQAVVDLGAFPGRPIIGRVEYVYPTLQSDARTLKARIAIPNPDGHLKPGMFATVLLSTPLHRALSVPISAVVRTGERNIVFVEMGAGEIMPHEIEVGRVTGQYAEVLAGLEAGQRVITSAQFLIDSESNLAEVMKAMMSQTNISDTGQMDMGAVPMDTGMKDMPMPGRER
jgi:Cu(I)/Ag(I) efflux system membrane fusion protein